MSSPSGYYWVILIVSSLLSSESSCPPSLILTPQTPFTDECLTAIRSAIDFLTTRRVSKQEYCQGPFYMMGWDHCKNVMYVAPTSSCPPSCNDTSIPLQSNCNEEINWPRIH